MVLHRDIWSVSVLAKAGAIVPMAQYEKQDNRLFNSPDMEVAVFPGADGRFVLYEDSGDYDGGYATTEMSLDWTNCCFTISPAQGETGLIPAVRNWKIHLRGFHKDADISVNIPGTQMQRDNSRNTTVISVTAPVGQEIRVRIEGSNLLHNNADVMDRCFEIFLYSQISSADKEHIWKCLQKDELLHEKIHLMSVSPSREISGVVGVIRELLTLTQEEYDI